MVKKFLRKKVALDGKYCLIIDTKLRSWKIQHGFELVFHTFYVLLVNHKNIIFRNKKDMKR